MNDFRLIALDIDGTVTDSHHAVRPRVRAAIQGALDRGVDVLLCSGRVLSTTAPIVAALDGRVGAITNNGAVAHLRLDEPPLWCELLPTEVVHEVIQRILPLGEPVAFDDPARSQDVFVSRRLGVPETLLCRFEGQVREVGDLLAWADHDLLLVTVLLGKGAAAETICKAQTVVLRELFAGRASVSPLWHPLYDSWILDFLAPGCDKWWALQRYAALRGVPESAILAIGDGLNDIPMVTGAGLGVAMGQAGPELRAVADVLVADNEHDGVAEAIERYVLA